MTRERPAAAPPDGAEYALGPDGLAALCTRAAYPGDASARSGIEHVQTHLSHVFLTGERVYKFRKAVDLGFVCFLSLAERDADCLREVSLGRRLAADVYLGVAPLLSEPVRIGSVSETLAGGPASEGGPEHCVVMRRLPAGRDALSLLERGALSDAQLDRAAALVARFHERHRLGIPAPFSPAEWQQRCVGPAQDNLRLLEAAPAGLLDPGSLRALVDRVSAFGAAHAERFERRRLAGRAVDGHGDLHLQHLWFERDDAEPIAIDCLEFSESLRRIDAAAEVAFPSMDLRYRGAPLRAERFLGVYARESDDYDLFSVVDFFASYRAAVRAKVASIAAAAPEIEREQRERAAQSARSHLDLAARSLDPRAAGRLVLMGGIVGSGKSSAAAELSGATGAIVIASDRVRKRLAGIAPTARTGAGPDEGIYAPAHAERVYAGLLERAAPVLASGRTAILDATFSHAAERQRALRFAEGLGVRAWFIETRCGESVTLERLARREAAGGDPSDAGPGFYTRSAASFEPLSDWSPDRLRVVATDRDAWRERLWALATEISG